MEFSVIKFLSWQLPLWWPLKNDRHCVEGGDNSWSSTVECRMSPWQGFEKQYRRHDFTEIHVSECISNPPRIIVFGWLTWWDFWKGDLSWNVNHENNFRLHQPVPVTLQCSTFEKSLRQSVREIFTDEIFITHCKTIVKVTTTTAPHQIRMG